MFTKSRCCYFLSWVNIVIQVYISLIYKLYKPLHMTMSIVYSQLSGHKWYVYIDKSLSISHVLFMYLQEMFLITNDVSILTKVYSNRKCGRLSTSWQNKDAQYHSKWHRNQSIHQESDIQLGIWSAVWSMVTKRKEEGRDGRRHQHRRFPQMDL